MRRTAMSINVEYLAEPKLQFGSYFEHEDSKTGLAEFGPFGKNIGGLHPPEIRLGFIGTGETTAGAKEWIEECGSEIESENREVIKGNAESSRTPMPLFGKGILDEAPAQDPSIIRVYKIL